MDLVVRNATIAPGVRVDLGISRGRIVQVGGAVAPAGHELDAGGGLVLPGFVDPHLHLDKALIWERLPPKRSATFQESIDQTLAERRAYTREDLLGRGGAVLEEAVVHGTTAVRAFADVGTVGGLTPVKALLELRASYADVISVQVCAFPQEGLIRDPGAEDLLAEAMALGADVVGAFPWFELTPDAAERHIEIAFEVAERFNADLHAFVDDEPLAPLSNDLRQVALATIRHGWQGRVTVSHACGLASNDEHTAERTIRLVKEAGITVCANAQVSLVSKCEHASEPRPRGITRVRQLLAMGVNVTTGQDDVSDPYYPFGRGDMLEVASFLAHTAQMYRSEQVDIVMEMITSRAAVAMRLEGYGLGEGCWADFVVFDKPYTPTELIRLQPVRRWVVRRGKLVASTEARSRVYRA